jgi:hypothetical protein
MAKFFVVSDGGSHAFINIDLVCVFRYKSDEQGNMSQPFELSIEFQGGRQSKTPRGGGASLHASRWQSGNDSSVARRDRPQRLCGNLCCRGPVRVAYRALPARIHSWHVRQIGSTPRTREEPACSRMVGTSPNRLPQNSGLLERCTYVLEQAKGGADERP